MKDEKGPDSQPSLDELVRLNKKDLYLRNSEYMLKQFPMHEFPKNPELRLNTIVNGIYQDNMSQIINSLFNKL